MKQDAFALGGGLLFIIFLLGMTWMWGELLNWKANSGYFHYEVNSSQQRLLPEPDNTCNDTSFPGRSGQHCRQNWYYWKLPPNESTATTKAVVWLLYSLHQIFVWGLIYRCQLTVNRNKVEGKQQKYSSNLRWFNWSMLAVNALFHILHLIQTHTTYDGLAQQVAMSTSQSSVIMMMVFVLLMEYKDRGIILMWPNPTSDDFAAKKLRLHPGPTTLIRKYHGYVFAWSSIYTFWYHPLENTWGHTLGFFHTAIVLLQGSLVFTEIHLNRYWRFLNETWVLIHSVVVAVQTGNPEQGYGNLWPLFGFGFGFLLAFTQIFGLQFWRKIPAWVRIVPPILYLGIVAALCGTVVVPKDPTKSGFSRMYEMLFVPAQEYMEFLLSWLFIFIFLVIESKVSTKRADAPESDKNKCNNKDFVNPSPTKQALYLSGVILIFAIFVMGSYFYEQAHYEVTLTVSSITFTTVFCIGVCIIVMFFKQLIGPSYILYNPRANKIRNQNENSFPTEMKSNEGFDGSSDL
ncbi:uncharacterized protein LOC120337662 [Styela clava]